MNSDKNENTPSSEVAELEFRRRTRRSFLVGGFAAGAAVAAWIWIMSRPLVAGLAWPLRRMLEMNGRFGRAFFSATRIGPRPQAPIAGTEPRVNGDIGLDEDVPERWRLFIDLTAGTTGRALSLETLKAMPRTETTTEFKCIEGWSTQVSYAGVLFSDFLRHVGGGLKPGANWPETGFPPEKDLYPYVALETPDAGYYVSLDMESALHPQTLIAYEMNGAPLSDENGAPARFLVPVKYGIKSLKRIGRIYFSVDRPRDYWAERGYDWYAGL